MISVTLPNYNHAPYLELALEGLLAQSYGDFEVLVVDDGSTDESASIIERHARRDARIKPVFFAQNQGALAAHADSWRRASGELVYQYSSDDAVIHKDFFQHAVDALARHPEVAGMFGCAALVSAETGAVTGQMGAAIPGHITPIKFMIGFLRFGFFVPGISSVWRREAVIAAGSYDRRLGPQADYFINHVLPALHGVVFVPEIFALARTFAARTTFSRSSTMNDELSRFALFEAKMRSALQALPIPDQDWNLWRARRYSEIRREHDA